MRRTLRTAVIAPAFLLGLTVFWAADQPRERQLQQAIDLMETKGDYPAAMKLFEEVAKSTDRNLAARSLLYVGQCYEKLGQDGAQKAYQRIVREFADQREVVLQARTRLDALAAISARAADGPQFRKVNFPFALALYGGGTLSPDGKAFALYSRGALWVVPVEGAVAREITGEPRKVTAAMGVSEAIAWSADGNWIAFGVGQDIYVVPSRGASRKRLHIAT